MPDKCVPGKAEIPEAHASSRPVAGVGEFPASHELSTSGVGMPGAETIYLVLYANNREKRAESDALTVSMTRGICDRYPWKVCAGATRGT